MRTPSTPPDAPQPVDQLWIITWYTCPPRISSYAPFRLTKKVRKGVKSVKPAHLNSMPASDEDPEHTNGRAATRRPTLDHNMVYVPTKNIKLRPFYARSKRHRNFFSFFFCFIRELNLYSPLALSSTHASDHTSHTTLSTHSFKFIYFEQKGGSRADGWVEGWQEGGVKGLNSRAGKGS